MRQLAVAAGKRRFDELVIPVHLGMGVAHGAEHARLAAQVLDVVDVDLGDDHAVLALVGGEYLTVFGDHAQTGEHVVGAAFALAGSGKKHCALEIFGAVLYPCLCLVGGAYGRREGCKAHYEACASQRMADCGGDRSGGVAAKLNAECERTGEVCGHDDLGAENALKLTLAAEGDDGLLIAFGSGKHRTGDLGAGDEGEDLALVDNGGNAVQSAAFGREGKSHDGENVKLLRRIDYLLKSGLGASEEDAVREKIVAGAARYDQFGEGNELYALCACRADTLNDAVCVVVGVRYPDHRGSGGNLNKSVFHFLNLPFEIQINFCRSKTEYRSWSRRNTCR